MVHARAFSFSDEAISVDLPAMSGIGRIASVSGTITGPQSHDPAILLFQLRRLQSHWYQALVQCDPHKPIDGEVVPTSFIWQMCQDMREWDESLPETLPIGIREFFDLELKYSYVYCLAPSARAPVMTAYGRVLIFEYAIAYLDHVYGLVHGAPESNPTFYTYHDALRVYFMGRQFMAVLKDAGDAVLAGASVPLPVSQPGKAPPPPLPARTSNEDNLTRSIRCLEGVKVTLKKYGERWTNAESLAKNFDMISEELVTSLKTKQQQGFQYVPSPQQQQPPPPQPQHPQPHQHQHMQQGHPQMHTMQPQTPGPHRTPPQQHTPQMPVTAMPAHMAGQHMQQQQHMIMSGPVSGQMHHQHQHHQMHPHPMQQYQVNMPPQQQHHPAMHHVAAGPPPTHQGGMGGMVPPHHGPPMQQHPQQQQQQYMPPHSGSPHGEVKWENVDIFR